MLGAILAAAPSATASAAAAFLLLAYSLGLAVPFLLSAVAFDRVTGGFRWLRDHYTVITVDLRRDPDRRRRARLPPAR